VKEGMLDLILGGRNYIGPNSESRKLCWTLCRVEEYMLKLIFRLEEAMLEVIFRVDEALLKLTFRVVIAMLELIQVDRRKTGPNSRWLKLCWN